MCVCSPAVLFCLLMLVGVFLRCSVCSVCSCQALVTWAKDQALTKAKSHQLAGDGRTPLGPLTCFFFCFFRACSIGS